MFYKYTSQSKQLLMLKDTISEAMKHKSQNKIMLNTEHASVRQLLVEVNHLYEQKVNAELKVKAQEETNKKMLANISHDLKTPLTVILGYAELLQQNTTEMSREAINEKVCKIEKNAKDVLKVIDIFFDLMKLESGDILLTSELVDISELCREEILNYYEVLQAEGFLVELNIPDKQVLVKADATALKRALGNLIQNAVHYGAEGKYLKVKVWEDETTGYIEIIDKGKGIVEDKQDKVFERLFTLEDSRNKKYQGSGLGLTITKRLIESMNGTISLKSIPYVETVFAVSLKKQD
jgi:signal transduction histidine kinase